MRFAVLPLLIFANFTFLAAQTDSIYRLPAGTRIRLRMDTEINSKVSSVNDTFTAVVAEPVIVRDVVVLAKGTVIEGRVASVSKAATGGRDGKLDVVFETLRVTSETQRNIDGVMVTKISAKRSQTRKFLTIIRGTATGAIIGIVSKVSNGALIGAAAGTGVGTAIALLRKGKDVRIREDQLFEIELKKEVVLPVIDY